MAFLDIDGFKSVNDSLGHAAGDELLVVVADRLRAAVRGRDIVGRLGGDEFLVVCPDVADPAEAVALAQRVQDAVYGTVTVGDTAIELRVSVGVAWSGAEDASAEVLVARADAIMYESKRRGDGWPTRPPSLHRQRMTVPSTVHRLARVPSGRVADVLNAECLEPLTDEELAGFALAADPDAPVDDDAVCLWRSWNPRRTACCRSGTCRRRHGGCDGYGAGDDGSSSSSSPRSS